MKKQVVAPSAIGLIAVCLLLHIAAAIGLPSVAEAAGEEAPVLPLTETHYWPGEIIIKLKDRSEEGESAARNSFVTSMDSGGIDLEPVREIYEGAVLYRLDTDVLSAIPALLDDPRVEYAHPHFKYYRMKAEAPNDASWGEQWGLHDEDSGVDLLDAWAYTAGSPEVIVGVIDSGLDYFHEDIDYERVVIVPGSNFAPCCGKYEDTPLDDVADGHGTHVSGILGATANNALGVAGVAPEVKIMPVKVFREDRSGTMNLNSAVVFAAVNGAKVVNLSLGGMNFDETLYNIMRDFSDVLFVAAAGNDGYELNGSQRQFPAMFAGDYNGYSALPNVVTVASTTRDEKLASHSNRSVHYVNLAAPGADVYSLFPRDETTGQSNYAYDSGTSMAAPHVSGAAALIYSLADDLSPAEVIDILEKTVKKLPSLEGNVKTGGTLNTGAAVAYTANRVAPVTIDPMPLSGAVPAGTAVTLSTETNDADIYYTLNGEEPTEEDGIRYIEGETITIDSPVTIKARAYKADTLRSKTSSFTYSLLDENAELRSLAVSGGALEPAFDPATTRYTVEVSRQTDSVTVTASTRHPGATMLLNGTEIGSGTASAPIALKAGINPLTVEVTAEDGIHTNAYSIDVSVPYTVTFDKNGGDTEAIPSVTTVAHGGIVGTLPAPPTRAGYTFGGWYADREALRQPFDFAAPFGDADVTLYAKWLSANALLSGLSADQGMLRPEFSPEETNYAIDVPKSVTGLNLFMRKGAPTQSLTVIGASYGSVTDEVYSYAVSNLTIGPNPIQVTVAAENQDRNTYQITVNVSSDEPMGRPIALDPSARTLTFPGGLAVRLPDGLSIPPGATLTVRESNAAPSEEVELDIAGQVIDFQFEGIAIDRPIEITLGYDKDSDPGKLAIYYYNDSTGKWEYQPSQMTDDGIKASVGRFSTYGVLSDTTAPNQVTVSPGEKTRSSITLHLDADDASGVAAYLIYRDGALVAETAESTYVDAGLTASRTYAYTVKAVDMLGNRSHDSESITVTTNGGGAGTGGIGGGPYSPASDAKVVSANGKLTLPANRAGEVRLGEAVTVIIPAGASDKVLTLTIENVSDPQQLLTDRAALASPVYEISKNVPESFKTKVTLIFSFDPSKVKAAQIPVVCYYDEAKKEWAEIAGGRIEGDRIAVEVDHFTKFAVFAVDRAAAASEQDPAKPGIAFRDTAGHWAEQSIKQAVSDGIVSGYPDGTFKPNLPITRAEFTVMLASALKLNGAGAALHFNDRDRIGEWTRRAVALAVQAGIVGGYEDGSFRPDARITRAEMATMVVKAMKTPMEADAATGFADDEDIPAWAKGAVEAIRTLGVASGRGGNEFAANDTATRAEAVQMILRMLARSGSFAA